MAVVCVLLPLSSWASPSDHYSPYDGWFERYSGRWLPQYDYRQLIAQCRQESGPDFNRFATSPAGAKGVCQFMRPAWTDAQLALGFVASPYSAKHNIQAAAWYMSRIDRIWISPRPKHERLKLDRAGYNTGAGHVLKAQRKCGDALIWRDISPCLPQVTGIKNARETVEYVQLIERWYTKLTSRVPAAKGERDVKRKYCFP